MVFHSVSESETPPPPPPSMAFTFSAKSQPLHNFSLKWSINQSNTQRLRTRLNNDHHHHHHHHHHHRSSRKRRYSGQSPELVRSNANSSGSVNTVSDGVKSGFSVSASSECVMEKEEVLAVMMSSIEISKRKLIGTGRRVEKKEDKFKGSEGKPKIFIRIPARNKAAVHDNDNNKAAVHDNDGGDEQQCAVEEADPVARTWNLRPRRAVTRTQNAIGGIPKSGAVLAQEGKSQAQGQPEMATEKVARKRKGLCVSLLKEEIEEDILIMTGSKPSRRPKKRARIEQKNMDEIFPGLLLTTVTPAMYRVRHKG